MLRDDGNVVPQVLDVDARKRAIVEKNAARRRFVETLK